MIAARGEAVGGPVSQLRAARRRFSVFGVSDSPRAKLTTLALLVALTIAVFLLTTFAGVRAMPPLGLVIPVMLGGIVLERPALRLLVVVVICAYGGEAIDKGWGQLRWGSAVVLAIAIAIAVELARDRERLGLSAGRGESILLALRDQLLRQGELPALPRGWNADVALRSAGGTTFGGDFIVSSLSDNGRTLELAVVDVSGKGLDAGTRALMLSGALGGLLGTIAPGQFLAAANTYLLRQEEIEGFATAVHVAIDLTTGHFRLSSAGHPPAAHYSGGSGRWSLVELDGSLLGLLPEATFGFAEGQLNPYDALLLYTDGLIEAPGRDLSVGIDRLLGGAERLVPRGFAGGASAIVEEVAPVANDDRAVVLLWRA